MVSSVRYIKEAQNASAPRLCQFQLRRPEQLAWILDEEAKIVRPRRVFVAFVLHGRLSAGHQPRVINSRVQAAS